MRVNERFERMEEKIQKLEIEVEALKAERAGAAPEAEKPAAKTAPAVKPKAKKSTSK